MRLILTVINYWIYSYSFILRRIENLPDRSALTLRICGVRALFYDGNTHHSLTSLQIAVSSLSSSPSLSSSLSAITIYLKKRIVCKGSALLHLHNHGASISCDTVFRMAMIIPRALLSRITIVIVVTIIIVIIINIITIDGVYLTVQYVEMSTKLPFYIND